MSALKLDLLQHIASGSDIPLDDWLNLVCILRERRKRFFGIDLLHDPPWAIIVILGRDANAGGLAFQEIVRAVGVSQEVTRRWLMILASNELVEELPGNWFKLSGDGRARLQKIYS